MKPAAFLSTLLLALMALAHLLRLALGIRVVAAHMEIPMWASVVAAVVPGMLAAALWRESRAG